MKSNLHLKSNRKTMIVLNKASYKSRVVFNFRQQTPKNIIKKFNFLDIKVGRQKSKSALELFNEKYSFFS